MRYPEGGDVETRATKAAITRERSRLFEAISAVVAIGNVGVVTLTLKLKKTIVDCDDQGRVRCRGAVAANGPSK